MFAAVGLKDIKIESITETTEFQSATHMWDVVTVSNPIGAAGMVADLTEEQRAAVRQASEDTTSDY